METRELQVFGIKELPEKVRNKILDKWRENMDFDYDWIWENFVERMKDAGIWADTKSLTFDLYRGDADFDYDIDINILGNEYFPAEYLAMQMCDDEDEANEMEEKLREDCKEEALTITSQLKRDLLKELRDAYEEDTSDERIIEWYEDDGARFLEDGHRVE